MGRTLKEVYRRLGFEVPGDEGYFAYCPENPCGAESPEGRCTREEGHPKDVHAAHDPVVRVQIATWRVSETE